MSKKTSGVVALVGLCALSLFLVNCGSSSSRPSGLLYVLSQASNDVSSFALDLGSGNLSLINSNAATCPASTTCGLPVALSLDPAGSTAFVLNQDSISGYMVGSDGSLSAPTTVVPTDAAPAPLGPMSAMASDAAGDLLFVISPGTFPSPSDCSNKTATDLNCPSISVYSTATGSTTATLTGNNCPQTTTPCAFQLDRIPTALSVITFTPTGGSTTTLLFVTSNKDLTASHNDNELSVYSVDSAGNLSESPISPYTTQVNPTSVLAVNTSPTVGGVFVYVGNQGPSTGSVSGFQVCTVANGACTPQQVFNNQLFAVGSPSSIGQNPVAMLTDPTNSFLFIACNVGNTVFGFRMTTATGILTALSPASQPTGSQPVALAMHPNHNGSGQFLYVSNNASSNITGFSVGINSGTLGDPITVPFTPGAPSGMAGR